MNGTATAIFGNEQISQTKMRKSNRVVDDVATIIIYLFCYSGVKKERTIFLFFFFRLLQTLDAMFFQYKIHSVVHDGTEKQYNCTRHSEEQSRHPNRV